MSAAQVQVVTRESHDFSRMRDKFAGERGTPGILGLLRFTSVEYWTCERSRSFFPAILILIRLHSICLMELVESL